jgi:hypothetical protein
MPAFIFLETDRMYFHQFCTDDARLLFDLDCALTATIAAPFALGLGMGYNSRHGT